MSSYAQPTEIRLCPFCGKAVSFRLSQCPFCREAIPQVQVKARPFAAEGRAKLRRGLLYMLLAGIIHYFAAGYSGMQLPVTIPSFVTAYLTPLLFLCGCGLTLYGLYLYLRAA